MGGKLGAKMNKTLPSLLIITSLALTGCAVTIAPPRVYVPTPVEVTVQPTVSGEIYLDTAVNLYFIVDIYRRRHYMPRGWYPHKRY